MTNQELIDYYVGLLIAQYSDKPKAQGHISALVSEAIAGQIIRAVGDGFDMDTAVGVQLDIIGRYKGISRFITGVELNKTFFAMPPYADASPGDYQGFAEYGGSDPLAYFEKYLDASAPYLMNDTEMRAIIKLKILRDQSNCSFYDIDNIVAEIFGDDQCLVTDNTDMTMTYAFTVASGNTIPAIAVALNLLPKPAGVYLDITGIA